MPRSRSFLWGAALPVMAAFLLAGPLAGQARSSQDEKPRLKVGFGLEYLNRTISWDGEASTSELNGLLFCFQAEGELRPGLALTVQAGYALTNFNGLIFRGLPFSVEYQAGYMAGVFLAGGLKARLLQSQSIEVELEAAGDVCLGFPDTWPIQDLAVDGTLEGKSTWIRLTAGPVLWYKGLAYYVFPYLRVHFNRLWGTFRMTETIETLDGVEDKKIAGSGPVSISLGVLSEVTGAIGLRAEVTAIPRRGGLDIGGAGRLIITF
jgi:hypothetical protein